MKYLFSVLILFFLFSFTAQSQEVADTIHVSHYAIHLTKINTSKQTITGWSETTVVSKFNNLNAFSLELKALTIDSVRVNNEACLYNQSDELVSIMLHQPVNENDELNVKIWYHGKPFHESWGGFHWSGNYAFNLGVGFESIPHNLGKAWFPCVDDFTNRAKYDFYVTVDNDKKAVCGGVLQSVTAVSDSTSTWHWKLNHEIPTYLASVAVGDYVLVEDQYIGIEDTVPIGIYVRPADSSKVEGSFVNLKEILRFFETHFGPYPFGRVGYVGTSIGAMEHAGNIAYPHFAFNGNTGYESLYAHELSHMWFGDQVTCASAEQMWLNEGWASFCEMYYLDGLNQHDKFVKEMHDRQKKVLTKTHFIDDGYWALAGVPLEYTYGSTSYDKGAVAVYTLQQYLGDSLFQKAMTAYLKKFTYQSADSREMQNFLTEYTGIDMKPFFDAWVYTPGTPHFSIDSTRTKQNSSNYQVDIYLQQRYKGAEFFADNNILEIGYVKDDFTIVTDTVHFSGKLGHSVKTLSFKPLLVLLDPFEKTADATMDQYKIFKQPQEYTFRDTYFTLFIDDLGDNSFVNVTHNWVAPDSLKYPITGLRISPGRYWKVEGVFPEGMHARGQFVFSSDKYFDKDMNLSDKDSVMILYRATPADEWEYVPQYLFGMSTMGYLYVNSIKPGEYVLAALDREYLKLNHKTKQGFKLFPNPTHGKLTLVLKEKADYNIKISDSSGRVFLTSSFSGKRKTVNIQSASEGVLLVSIFKNGRFFASQKVIYSK